MMRERNEEALADFDEALALNSGVASVLDAQGRPSGAVEPL